MKDIVISCDRCKAQIGHRCHTELMPAIVKLFTWTPETTGILDKKSSYYSEGDEEAPFLSETYLYNLLGKEDARTLLGLVNQVVAAAGIDDMGVWEAVGKELEAIEKQREEKRKDKERGRLIHRLYERGAKGMWIPEDQWPLLEHLNNYPERWQISDPVTRNGVTKKKFVNIPREEDTK